MARTITLPPEPWFDPSTGNPTVQFRAVFEELLSGRSTNSIGTVISGVNAVKTATLAEAAADQDNTDAPDSDITATANPTKATGSGGTTNNVTVSISGGTAPYALAWTRESGDTFTVNGPASLAADGDAVFGFSTAQSGDRVGVQKLTITDDRVAMLGGPRTATLSVSTTVFDFSGVNA